MAYTLFTKKLLEQAEQEAQHYRSPRIEPEHIMIAMCKLSCNTDASKETPELRILQDFFKAGNISPLVLAEHLCKKIRRGSLPATSPPSRSGRCEEVIKCADQEGQGAHVNIEHLLVPLVVELSNNLIFKNTIKDIEGNFESMRKKIGLSPYPVSTEMAKQRIPSRINTADVNKKGGGPVRTITSDSPKSLHSNLSIRDKFDQADKAMKEQKWFEAVRKYEEALKESPSVSPAWSNLGVAYMRLEKFTEAKSAFNKAMELNPRSDDAYANMGVLLAHHLCQPKQAEDYLRQALRLNPRHSCRSVLEFVQKERAMGIKSGRLVPRKPHHLSVSFHRKEEAMSNIPVSSPRKQQPVGQKDEISLKSLQDAANYELLPKTLFRMALVCLMFGIISIASGTGLYKDSPLFLIPAGLGSILILVGMISTKLRRYRGLLREAQLFLLLGIICIVLFFLVISRVSVAGTSQPWGQLVLLAFLGMFQLRAASDCFSRYQIFKGMPVEIPSAGVLKRLEELRKEIIDAKASLNPAIIEFTDKMGNWKGKLEAKTGIYVNVNLGDILFVDRDKTEFNQLIPGNPAILLKLDKKRKTVRMVEPYVSRMRKWAGSIDVCAKGFDKNSRQRPVSLKKTLPGNNKGPAMRKMKALQGQSFGPAKQCLANCIKCNKPIIFLLPDRPIRGQRAQIVNQHQCLNCRQHIFATTCTTGQAILAEECSIVSDQMQFKKAVELIIDDTGGLSFRGTKLKPTPLVVGRNKDGNMTLLSPEDMGLEC